MPSLSEYKTPLEIYLINIFESAPNTSNSELLKIWKSSGVFDLSYFLDNDILFLN